LVGSGFTKLQDHKWKKRADDLFIELAGSALTTVIGTGIGFLLAQQPVQHLLLDTSFWTFVIVVTLLGWGLIHFVRQSRLLKKQLTSIQEQAQVQNMQLAQFDIQYIYSNREACNHLIQEKIKKSSLMKFFLLIGSDFAEDSGIYMQALQDKPAGNAKIQILVSSADSPFLSERRINNIREDKENSRKQMLAMLEAVEKHLVVLKRKMKRKDILIDWRKHRETFLCKFHLFDDCVIFCFNVVTSDNDKVSPYFVVQKNKEHSLYAAFQMYFDFVWSKSSKPEKSR
jgi:hypothetical protein